MSTEYHKKEAKTLWVVLLSAVAMVVEIIFGIITNSMALFADGIHMGAHVLAIGLSWLAAMIWDLPFIDAIIAILSAMVVIKWSIGILKDSGSILLEIETVQKVNNSGVEHINHHHIT